ncbi:MAG: hypothetical protein Q9172_000837 [Xanthocarpia lactea]
MSVTIIDRPTGNGDESSKHPAITRFTPVASYNWVDVPNPTILVPAPDTGFSYVDQNADRYPKSPISPLFSSVLQVQPTYPFSSVDVVSDRSPLRKLYAFAAREPNLKNFRFGFSVFGDDKKTVVCHRMEEKTREEFEEGQFHGYRAAFEAQCLRPNGKAQGAKSHYRISEYEFGGLKFLVRSGVDGSIANTDGHDTTEAEDLSLRELEILSDDHERDTDKKKAKLQVEDSANHLDTLAIIPTTNALVPQSTLLEFITRSRFSKYPFILANKMPDLYLTQTGHFVEAYYHNVGYWKFMKEKTQARFALADIHVRTMGEELKKWEEDNGNVLERYLKIIQQILKVVRGKGENGEGNRVWMVEYTGDGAGLEVKEVMEGNMLLMKDEIGRFFSGEK